MTKTPSTKLRLKLVDSTKRKLNLVQILAVAGSHTNSPYDPRFAAGMICAELKHPGAKYVTFGNTAFVVHDMPEKSECYMRAINADVPNNYIKNIISFIEWMPKHGYYIAATQFDDPKIIQVIKTLWEKYLKKVPKAGYNIAKLKNGGYQATVKIGESNG
jgi:hypothetical protein